MKNTNKKAQQPEKSEEKPLTLEEIQSRPGLREVVELARRSRCYWPDYEEKSHKSHPGLREMTELARSSRRYWPNYEEKSHKSAEALNDIFQEAHDPVVKLMAELKVEIDEIRDNMVTKKMFYEERDTKRKTI